MKDIYLSKDNCGFLRSINAKTALEDQDLYYKDQVLLDALLNLLDRPWSQSGRSLCSILALPKKSLPPKKAKILSLNSTFMKALSIKTRDFILKQCN